LQLGEDVVAAVDPDEPLEALAPGGSTPRASAAATGPRPPPVRQTRPPANSASSSNVAAPFPFGARNLHAGQQAAEILVPFAIFHQQRQPAAVGSVISAPTRAERPSRVQAR